MGQHTELKGIFITFEGPDGSGKTTQLKRLAEALEGRGRRVVVTREPGGTPIGDQIRAILLSAENTAMNAQAETLLLAASRAQHVHEKILPSLARGDIVLCDRYVDASIAYQAAGLGLNAADVRAVNRFAISGLMPHRTYMLDIAPEVGRQRIEQRLIQSGAALDRIEQKDIQYHRRVREAFLQIAREEPDRVYLLDASRHPDDIFTDIYADCQRLLREMHAD
jgi:dTMP kinase